MVNRRVSPGRTTRSPGKAVRANTRFWDLSSRAMAGAMTGLARMLRTTPEICRTARPSTSVGWAWTSSMERPDPFTGRPIEA